MTCLEAQSKIIAYVEYNLEKDQKTEFLKHIQCCENCKDELNIYYTMLEGMRQLDNNIPLTKDFTQELNNRIERELKQNKKKKGVVRSSVALTVVLVFSFLIVAYVNFLTLVYEDEQSKLKAAQGENYFSETFKEYIFVPEEQVLILNVEEKTPETTFYEKIRYHKIVND